MTRRHILAAATLTVTATLGATGYADATNFPSCLKHHTLAYCEQKYHPTTTTIVPAPTTTVVVTLPSSSPSFPTSTAGAGTPPASVLARVELPATGSGTSLALIGLVVLALGGTVLVARRRSDEAVAHDA